MAFGVLEPHRIGVRTVKVECTLRDDACTRRLVTRRSYSGCLLVCHVGLAYSSR